MRHIIKQSYLGLAQLICRAQTPGPFPRPMLSLNISRFLSYPFPRNLEEQAL